MDLEGSDRVNKFRLRPEATEGSYPLVQQYEGLELAFGSVPLVLVSLCSDETVSACWIGTLGR